MFKKSKRKFSIFKKKKRMLTVIISTEIMETFSSQRYFHKHLPVAQISHIFRALYVVFAVNGYYNFEYCVLGRFD